MAARSEASFRTFLMSNNGHPECNSCVCMRVGTLWNYRIELLLRLLLLVLVVWFMLWSGGGVRSDGELKGTALG
jgi:hypothetical protein